MTPQEKIDKAFDDLATLIRSASEQLDQSATHDGLTNCDTLAKAKKAWAFLLTKLKHKL